MTTELETNSSKHANCAKDRRVEDQWKLRELEMQTDFRIQTLSDALNAIKIDFHSFRESVNEKIEAIRTQNVSLNNRINILLVLMTADMVQAPSFIMRLFGL